MQATVTRRTANETAAIVAVPCGERSLSNGHSGREVEIPYSTVQVGPFDRFLALFYYEKTALEG
jgi:hypothetical protein